MKDIPLLYAIDLGSPTRGMSGFGFCIKLWPAFKDLVAASDINQQKAEHAISSLGRAWLDVCGYDAIFDPDADPLDKWEQKHIGKPPKYGPNARPLYEPNIALHVTWGEWGLEHITVPGDGCGLDINTGFGAPPGGRILSPHNIDSISQAYLIQIVFSWFVNAMIIHYECKRMDSK